LDDIAQPLYQTAYPSIREYVASPQESTLIDY